MRVTLFANPDAWAALKKTDTGDVIDIEVIESCAGLRARPGGPHSRLNRVFLKGAERTSFC